MADIYYNDYVSQQSHREVVQIAKKVGRPFSENPKEIRLTVRLEKKHDHILESYRTKNNVTKNEAVRRGIEKLDEKA